MKVYIRPQAIQAISFDLDDTLYDNRPVITQAESALQIFLHEQYPRAAKWQFADWRRLKLALFSESPGLRHDTTLARLAMLSRGLQELGYDAKVAKKGAEAGLAHFVKYRSNFKVSAEVVELLIALKAQYRLIGITNGNVDHQRIGLAGLFEFVQHPGHGYKQKPSTQMFTLAAEKLGLPLTNILHVGDSASSDVDGARRAGCQSVWLNPSFGVAEKSTANKLLPHLEISSLQQLRLFI